MGGSLALAARASGAGWRIIGCDSDPRAIQKAMEIGAIDVDGELNEVAADSDLLILCTPIGAFKSVLRTISEKLKSGAIVTDVGSTKRSVTRSAEKFRSKSFEFVPSHPMAGSDKKGVEFARADLFRNRVCLITPASENSPNSVKIVEQFWQSLGMKTVQLTPREHDRIMADVSHLPHLLAAALVAMQTDSALEFSGPGFLDTTRIAGGDGSLWRDILIDNRDNLRRSLKKFRSELDGAIAAIESGDKQALSDWLDRAAQRRKALHQQKMREVSGD